MRKKESRSWYLKAAAVLVGCMVLGLVLPASGASSPVDVTKECSLTIDAGQAEDAEKNDLAEADVVIDLYKVADAEADSQYDTYNYKVKDEYRSLEEQLGYDSLQKMDEDSFRELADQAAAITFQEEDGIAKVAVDKCKDGVPVGTRIEGLESGLYLAAARGGNLTDPKDYVSNNKNKEGNGELVTIANSSKYQYSFLPQFITLPATSFDTSGGQALYGGEWQYDITASLKYSREVRRGSLEIEKTLETYEDSEPVTFVFQIEGYADESRQESVYSNVVSLAFDAPGTRSVLVEDAIPAFAYVEVTEVYSGAAYTLVSDPVQTAVIRADESEKVSFANTYDGGGNSGGSVTNSFQYQEETGWSWSKLADSTQQADAAGQTSDGGQEDSLDQ